MDNVKFDSRSLTVIEKCPVQYITDDFLRRCTRAHDLSSVHHLCLTSNVLFPYKIKFLDNLHNLRCLTVLNVSGNLIENLDGIRSLTRLKFLNLNQNNVACLDGLETLKNLQKLFLNSNVVKEIPPWFQQRLQSLKTLHIGYNKIDDIHQLTKLRELKNLTELVIQGNPIAILKDSQPSPSSESVDEQGNLYKQCCRAFAVFHLRFLTILDGQIVDSNERRNADLWFDQPEVSRLNNQLESREADVTQLTDCLARLSIKAEGSDAIVAKLSRQTADQEMRLSEMHQEMEAKDELLRTKTDELLRACLKHYEIERELAFFKIDNKLALALGKAPDVDMSAVGRPMTSIGNDSPYLGKCRYIRIPATGVPGPRLSTSREIDPAAPSPPTRPTRRQASSFPNGHSNRDSTSSASSSESFSDQSTHQQQHQQHSDSPQSAIASSTPRKRSTPGRLTLLPHVPAGRGTTSGTAVTMPYFSASSPPDDDDDDDDDDHCLSSPPSHCIAASTVRTPTPSNWHSHSRSSVRIQCDSGLETTTQTMNNNSANDCHESSLDDGRIESLPESGILELVGPQLRDSCTQVCLTQSLSRKPSSDEANSPVLAVAHRHWQKRTRQRLAKNCEQQQQSTESVVSSTGKPMVDENDELQTIKKELARLQALVQGSFEGSYRLPETDLAGATRRTTVVVAQSCSSSTSASSASSSSPGSRSSHSDQSQSISSAPVEPHNHHHHQHHRTPRVSYSRTHHNHHHHQHHHQHLAPSSETANHGKEGWCDSDHGAVRGQNDDRKMTPTQQRHRGSLRGAASAVDICETIQSRGSVGCLKRRGKSMEALSANAPLDVRLLYDLQNELYQLHDHLRYSEGANNSRLEEAIRHISVLERELRNKRDHRGSSDSREALPQFLDGLEEIRRCRDSILDIQRKLTQNGRRDDKNGCIEEMKVSIGAQEKELSKLIQMVTQLKARDNGIDATEAVRIPPMGKLLCNVTEHHNMEDYIQHLREKLLKKGTKLAEVNNSISGLQNLLQERERALAKVTDELLASKRELLKAHERVKSIVSDRSPEFESNHRRKSELQRLDSRISELTTHLGTLQDEVSAVERQRDKRQDELNEVSRKLDEKQSQLEKVASQINKGPSTDATRAAVVQSMSPQFELHTLQSQIAEAKGKMSTLSREIGVRTAELELLNSKKSQETRFLEVQLENTQKELQARRNDLEHAKDELTSIRLEYDRVASDLQSPGGINSMQPTSEGIPTISVDVHQMALRQQVLETDIAQKTNELAQLDSQRSEKRRDLTHLEQSLTEARGELDLTQMRRQNAETQLALTRQKSELLRNQMETFEASVEVKQKLFSDLCAASESRVSAMAAEVSRLMHSTQQISKDRANLRADVSRLTQEVQTRSTELRSIKDEIAVAANKHRDSAPGDELTAAGVSNLSDQLGALNEQFVIRSAELESVTRVLEEKRRLVEELEARLQASTINSCTSDDFNPRFEELGGVLRKREDEIASLIADKTKLLTDHAQLVSELTDARAQVEATQRACKKLRRRTARELADLERVAEDQCNRASGYAQELTHLRRNYIYLQARIAANEEVADREQKLQEALSAIRAEIASAEPTPEALDAALQDLNNLEGFIHRDRGSNSSRLCETPSSIPNSAGSPSTGLNAVSQQQQEGHIPTNKNSATKKSKQPSSSSGIASSITPQSSIDSRLLNAKTSIKRHALENQSDTTCNGSVQIRSELHRLKNHLQPHTSSSGLQQ